MDDERGGVPVAMVASGLLGRLLVAQAHAAGLDVIGPEEAAVVVVGDGRCGRWEVPVVCIAGVVCDGDHAVQVDVPDTPAALAAAVTAAAVEVDLDRLRAILADGVDPVVVRDFAASLPGLVTVAAGPEGRRGVAHRVKSPATMFGLSALARAAAAAERDPTDLHHRVFATEAARTEQVVGRALRRLGA